jgi:hypothetical protein
MFFSVVRHLRHPRESGNPAAILPGGEAAWISAFAGMTGKQSGLD